MSRFSQRPKPTTAAKSQHMTVTIDVDAKELRELLAQLEAELASYKEDAEKFIWLRDYSPLPEGEDRATKAAELDALCAEGVKELKASFIPA